MAEPQSQWAAALRQDGDLAYARLQWEQQHPEWEEEQAPDDAETASMEAVLLSSLISMTGAAAGVEVDPPLRLKPPLVDVWRERLAQREAEALNAQLAPGRALY